MFSWTKGPKVLPDPRAQWPLRTWPWGADRKDVRLRQVQVLLPFAIRYHSKWAAYSNWSFDASMLPSSLTNGAGSAGPWSARMALQIRLLAAILGSYARFRLTRNDWPMFGQSVVPDSDWYLFTILAGDSLTTCVTGLSLLSIILGAAVSFGRTPFSLFCTLA